MFPNFTKQQQKRLSTWLTIETRCNARFTRNIVLLCALQVEASRVIYSQY